MQMMMQAMYVLQIVDKACHIDEVDGKCVGGVDNVGETDVGDDDDDDGDNDDDGVDVDVDLEKMVQKTVQKMQVM